MDIPRAPLRCKAAGLLARRGEAPLPGPGGS